ncbi:MAG: DUF420 domain-containing protein [Verrucomicrobiota bacterium]
MTVSDLPALNASLNSVCTLLLVLGFIFVKRDRKRAHVICMISALAVSAAFLVSYLIYHYHVGSVKFTAEGVVRPVYFFILISHILLAMVLPVLVVLTVVPAARLRFDRHRRVARWTWPVWMYVSVTGVLVYLMLYVWYPPST